MIVRKNTFLQEGERRGGVRICKAVVRLLSLYFRKKTQRVGLFL